MKILLLNPNTSAAMSAHIAQQAQRHCVASTTLVSATASFGGEVIASRVSYAVASHAVLDVWAHYAGQVDATLLACFGDPGLAALRELAKVPVLGLLEASLHAVDSPFAVVTAGTAWQSMLEERIILSPQAQLSRGVYAMTGMDGLTAQREPELFLQRLIQTVQQATNQGAETIILGGSVMAGLGDKIQSTKTASSIRLIDPMQAAMQQLQRPLAAAKPIANSIHFSGLSPHLLGQLNDA